jgi:hypothetical protein
MRTPWLGFFIVALVAAGACQQMAANVKLRDLTAVWLAPNVALQAAYGTDPATGDSERCAAITTWERFPWPPYYKWGIGYGLTTAWKAEHGKPFCTTKPSTFDHPYLSN